MSVKANHEALPNVSLGGQKKDPYGLPVGGNSPRRDAGVNRQTPRSRQMCDGVRVPILKDMDRYSIKGPGATCRFDIVEKVTTVIKAGAYGPSEYNTSLDEPGKNVGSHVDHGHRITLNVSRQPTFHSTGTRASDQDVWAKIGPYKWNQWVKTAGEGDARDVLYKNTYCLERDNLRYRSLTLPRIGADRPRTVGDKPAEYRPTTPDHAKNSTGVTIVPQQPRGTVVRFREYMRPSTYSSEGSSLEIKRVNSKKQHNHFTTVKNAFPVIRHDSRQCSRKSERPLKFENSRYNRTQRETLFTKPVLPIHKSAFERDYSSADTFKEYLDSLQQCATTTNVPYVYSRENTKLDRENMINMMNHHNLALQRVKSVNEPPEAMPITEPVAPSVPPTPRPDNRSITIEIKSSWKEQEENESTSGQTPRQQEGPHKPGTIDNLSSVHGSVVKPNPVAGPTSSTVVNAEIKPVPETLPEPPSPRVSEGGATCPTNTPTPMDDE